MAVIISLHLVLLRLTAKQVYNMAWSRAHPLRGDKLAGR